MLEDWSELRSSTTRVGGAFLLGLLPASLSTLDVLGADDSPTATEPQSAWSWNATVGASESYDDNVYLQDVSSLAKKDSFVTTLSASAGLSYKPCDEFKASLQYSPDFSFYHSESSEDHSVHRVSLNLDGSVGKGSWKWLNSMTVIDGESRGVVFTSGDAPATGGIPIRNRRDAAIWVNSINYTHPIGDWFLRPAFTLYIHDWQTDHRTSPPQGLYLNYVDRNDFAGGLDVGYTFVEKTSLVMGYRIGHQTQASLMDNPIEYSNYYQRVLLGIEGKPADWLDVTLAVGPDFRAFGDNIQPGFNSNMTVVYMNGAVTIKPSPKDSVQLSIKQYMQPGFGGRSIYEDITYTASWTRNWTEALSSLINFNVYGTDFVPPASRLDRIYTPSAAVTYKIVEGLTAQLAYSYDWSESRVVNTPAREFTRHIVTLGAKYKF